MNTRFVQLSLAVCALLLCAPLSTKAAAVDSVRGQIVLQYQRNGEAWYIDPTKKRRFALGKKKQAYKVLRSRAVGVGKRVLKGIPRAKDDRAADPDIFRTYKGKVILNINKNGMAWYVDPVSQKRYKLKNPKQARKVIQTVGQPIKTKKLKKITKGSGKGRYVKYNDKKLDTNRGTFRVKVLSMARSKAKVKTLSVNSSDCFAFCGAQSVKQFVQDSGAIAGINATYFCADCGSMSNSYLSPLWNSGLGRMINAYKLPFHHGPMMAITKSGHYYYYHRGIDFGWTVEDFEERTGRQLAAAVSNYPSLVEGGDVVIQNEELESSMLNDRERVAIGYTKKRIYFVMVHDANVRDLAWVMKKLRIRNAMNLDGGTSTALFTLGQHKIGPGRLVPNAIVLK